MKLARTMIDVAARLSQEGLDRYRVAHIRRKLVRYGASKDETLEEVIGVHLDYYRLRQELRQRYEVEDERIHIDLDNGAIIEVAPDEPSWMYEDPD